MNTHTPGPWSQWPNRTVKVNGYPAVIIGSEHASVCFVQTGNNEPTEQANARLISLAPTMYDYIKSKADSGDVEAKRIVDLIARAKGGAL